MQNMADLYLPVLPKQLDWLGSFLWYQELYCLYKHEMTVFSIVSMQNLGDFLFSCATQATEGIGIIYAQLSNQDWYWL